MTNMVQERRKQHSARYWLASDFFFGLPMQVSVSSYGSVNAQMYASAIPVSPLVAAVILNDIGACKYSSHLSNLFRDAD